MIRRSMVVAVMAGVVGALLTVADEPPARTEAEKLRFLQAENKVLRAAVQSLNERMAELKAEVAKLRAENAGLRNAGATTRPVSKHPVVEASMSGRKMLSVSDLVALGRRAKERGLTKLKRSTILHEADGKLVSLEASVQEVSPNFRRPGLAGTASLRAVYKSREMIFVMRGGGMPGGFSPGGGKGYKAKVPAVQINLTATLPLDRAGKLNKGQTAIIVGTVKSLALPYPSYGKQVVLSLALDGRAPAPLPSEPKP